MSIRNRIVDFRRVQARTLQANQRNWRTHPGNQREAMEAVLTEIGYADALLAREMPNGELELIDGHLRAEVTPDEEVPVLIVDLNDEEANLLLAVHDTIPKLAETDEHLFTTLLSEIDTADEAINDLFATAMKNEKLPSDFSADVVALPEVEIDPVFHVIVECTGEADQRDVYEQMTAAGHACRVLTL